MSATPGWNETSAKFYDAEERWCEDYIDDDLDNLAPTDVQEFLDDVLRRSDFVTYDPSTRTLVKPTPPRVVWEVSDESDLSGRYDPTDDALHLHPKIVGKSLVLHELAHWLDPRPRDGQGHGDEFLSTFSELVEIVFGEEFAEALREYVEGNQ